MTKGYANPPSSTPSILLIGGAGFIGTYLATALRALGHKVTILDNLSINNLADAVSMEEIPELHLEFLLHRFRILRRNQVTLLSGDATIEGDVRSAVTTVDPTHIVLLSAMASATRAERQPQLARTIQMLPLMNAMRSVTRRVHMCLVSSSMVYGDWEEGEIVSEDHPLNGTGVYARSKIEAEGFLREWGLKRPGSTSTIIRPSALYGPWCKSGRVTQKFVERALSKLPLVLHNGGSGKLDFTHIADLTRGITLALFGGPKGICRTYNLTFGEGRKIVELVPILDKALKDRGLEQPRIEESSTSSVAPLRGTLDISRATGELGYIPRIPLELGYSSYVDWYVDQWERKEGEE